jgi:hypothetical protein
LVIGALSDVFLIRNGPSYSGLTLLDKNPVLWPVWLAFILLCAFLLEWKGRPSREKNSASAIPGPALAIWLGVVITHAILFRRRTAFGRSNFCSGESSLPCRPFWDGCWRER